MYPIRRPSTNILVAFFFKSSFASKKCMVPKSNSFSTISSDGIFTEIIPESARFFTRPQLEPSGVSLGQILPKCVACKSLASKFGWVLLNGD